MLGQTLDNRIFVYEVTGLRQNNRTDLNTYPVRNSGSTFIQVPLNRMNEEMRRITRLGGTIVTISPLAEVSAPPEPKKSKATKSSE
jgi:sulfite reductase alpha subunit-like flavoprotein